MSQLKLQVQKRIQDKLANAARTVLAAHKPFVIGITGSVGKTSTKEAVATVLAAHEEVLASKGNYNNELGVPLTVLDERSPRKKLFGWWALLRRSKKLANPEAEYPKALVLEMAMDRPGDLAKLVEIAKPNLSIVTNVGETHLEFFKSIEAIAEEKATLVTELGPDGIAVLNVDNQWTRQMQKLHSGRTVTFGIDNDADVRAENVRSTSELPEGSQADATLRKLRGLNVPLGTVFELTYKGQRINVTLVGMLGVQQVYSALAAAAVGLERGMSLEEIAKALTQFIPPKGRMNLIPGIKDSLIIDDSYNAAPASTIAALDVLGSLKPSGRRVAVLGDMAELGVATESGHKQVGEHAARTCDFAVFVGPKSKFAAAAAEAAGLVDERQTHVMEARQVEGVLQKVLRAGDVVLIKGSQSIRVDRAVKALMAEPERAKELLVRQSEGWEENP